MELFFLFLPAAVVAANYFISDMPSAILPCRVTSNRR